MYKINDVYESIQGEGVQTGVPMVVLRLQGCGVGCPWCDTKQTWAIDPDNEKPELEQALGDGPEWALASCSEVAAFIGHNYPTFGWVLVTGGEPADQDLEGLVNALQDSGYNVALETSGTAIGHLVADFDHVCVSPKIDMPGGKEIVNEVVRNADEIKYVVGKQSDIERLLQLLEESGVNDKHRYHRPEICLQPVSQSKKATDLCIAACKAHGWRLSVQVHKFLELP